MVTCPYIGLSRLFPGEKSKSVLAFLIEINERGEEDGMELAIKSTRDVNTKIYFFIVLLSKNNSHDWVDKKRRRK